MYDECVNLRTQRRYTVLQVFTRLTSQHACIWENEKARHSGEGKGDRKEKKKSYRENDNSKRLASLFVLKKRYHTQP